MLKYFRRALTVSATKQSGVDMVIAMLEERKCNTEVLSSANISVRDALRTRGVEAKRVILKELKQMSDRKVFRTILRSGLDSSDRRSTIRSSMFLKAKYHPEGTFDKLKARLVAGGDQQDKTLYDDLSSATVSTSSVFTLAAVAAHVDRCIAVVDIDGAFLNADMGDKVPVHMRLDRTMSEFLVTLSPSYTTYVDDRGGLTIRLDKALFGYVESSGLWYENLRATMPSLGYKRNEMDVCVFNRRDSMGVQCTVRRRVLWRTRGWVLSHRELRGNWGPGCGALPIVQTADSDEELDRGGASQTFGLGKSGPLSAEFPYTAGIQHASCHGVPG